MSLPVDDPNIRRLNGTHLSSYMLGVERQRFITYISHARRFPPMSREWGELALDARRRYHFWRRRLTGVSQ